MNIFAQLYVEDSDTIEWIPNSQYTVFAFGISQINKLYLSKSKALDLQKWLNILYPLDNPPIVNLIDYDETY